MCDCETLECVLDGSYLLTPKSPRWNCQPGSLGAEWVLSRKAGYPPPSMRKVRVHILCGVKIILCGVKMETITGQDLEIAILRLY